MQDFKKEMRQEMKDFEAKNNTKALLESAEEVLSWPKLLAVGAILAIGAYGYHVVNKKINKSDGKKTNRKKKKTQ